MYEAELQRRRVTHATAATPIDLDASLLRQCGIDSIELELCRVSGERVEDWRTAIRVVKFGYSVKV